MASMYNFKLIFMKIRKIFYPVPIVLAIVLNSCYEGENLTKRYHEQLLEEKATIGEKTQAEQYNYLSKHLDVLRNGILTLSTDENFKKVLYPEIEKQFDGDYNVLLNTLAKQFPRFISKASEYRLPINGAFTVSLNAFSDITDSTELINLYPQLYIPNYNTLVERGVIGRRNPVIVSFNGDESTSEWQGVYLNSTGNMKEVTFNSSFLLDNEVWVISLNDATEDQMGEIRRKSAEAREKSHIDYPACIETNLCDGSSTNWTDGRFGKIAIHCSKESTLGGLAELSITAYASYVQHINPFNGQPHPPEWVIDPTWNKIAKFSLGGCRPVSHMLYPGWKLGAEGTGNAQGTDGNLFFYILFEHDAWPAAIKFANPTHVEVVNGAPVTTSVLAQYRSTDVAYYHGVMDSTPEADCHGYLCKNDHPCTYKIWTDCIQVLFKTTN
jgi:hypothetical protein